MEEEAEEEKLVVQLVLFWLPAWMLQVWLVSSLESLRRHWYKYHYWKPIDCHLVVIYEILSKIRMLETFVVILLVIFAMTTIVPILIVCKIALIFFVTLS